MVSLVFLILLRGDSVVIEIHGFPGSGKTTVLTMIAQNALKGRSVLGLPKTKTVFTSFPCSGCYQLDFYQLGKLNFHDCLIIIDEISLYADNRNFKNFSDALLYFFKLHRHANINLVWCSQNATDADKKIRGVTEKSYIIDALGAFTMIKPIEKFHSVKNGEPAEIFRLGRLHTWKWCYRPKWYKYFDSYDRKALPDFVPELWECNFNDLNEKKCSHKKITNLLSNIKLLPPPKRKPAAALEEPEKIEAQEQREELENLE